MHFFYNSFTGKFSKTTSQFFKDYYAPSKKKSDIIESKPMVYQRNTHLPWFQNGQQADAQEYIQALLENLSTDLDKRKGPYTQTNLSDKELKYFELQKHGHFSSLMIPYSIIDDLFFSWQKSYHVCKTNRKKALISTLFEPFLNLSLALDPKFKKLEELLIKYQEEEVLGRKDLYICPDGKKVYGDTKKISFLELNHYLMIQIKRFDSSHKKLEQKIKIPSKLKIKTEEDQETIYQLYGSIRQHGSFSGGHYTSYIKTFSKGWYLCNDVSFNFF